jgi:hypothetical protein
MCVVVGPVGTLYEAAFLNKAGYEPGLVLPAPLFISLDVEVKVKLSL